MLRYLVLKRSFFLWQLTSKGSNLGHCGGHVALAFAAQYPFLWLLSSKSRNLRGCGFQLELVLATQHRDLLSGGRRGLPAAEGSGNYRRQSSDESQGQ